MIRSLRAILGQSGTTIQHVTTGTVSDKDRMVILGFHEFISYAGCVGDSYDGRK
jgi:hypothetical protein